jgi:GNAT superfamily N-acetyltransferase
MRSGYILVSKPPEAFSEPEILDFMALVHAGNEVGNVVLERNVRNATCLVFGRQASCLVGVAALKNPLTSYRQNIESKAVVALNDMEFPCELGYEFVLPSARLQGLAVKLCQAALSLAEWRGVFATARTNNDGMAVVLAKVGFSKAGQPYRSSRSDYRLQLFVRYATRQAVPADSHASNPAGRPPTVKR